MYELDLDVTEFISGGADSNEGSTSIIRGSLANAAYGFVQGVPFGMYFGGKFGASGGFFIGALNQLIGVLGGGCIASVGFALMGLLLDDKDFKNYMESFRQIMLPGATS